MNFHHNESPYYSPSPSSISSPPDHAQSPPASSQKRKAEGRRKSRRETRHPEYRGVRQRNGNRWVCEVREPNKKSRIWMGTYPTPEMAARAHDVAVLALKGSSAVFNFPDSVSLLPVAKSSSAADIREAASKAAIAFTPTTSTKACVVEFQEEKINVNNDDDETRPRSIMFFDEEALYNMHGLLDSMAEGLLITPPSMKRALNWEDIDCETDLTLWTD